MRKCSINQEYVAIKILYVPNNRATKHIKHKLTELQRDETFTTGDI